MVRRELVAAADLDPVRLDRFLAAQLPGLGRRRVSALISDGQVELDGRRATKSELVRPGARVHVLLPSELGAEQTLAGIPDMPLCVLLETEHLVVVDKPAGLASVALPGKAEPSLAAGLVARYPEMRGVGYGAMDAGLLHRLDTGTSGLMIAARSAAAFSALRHALAAEDIDKRYLALVPYRSGHERGQIEAALAPDPKNRRKIRVSDPDARGARRALTRYRELAHGNTWALLEVRAPRAYRHQVRVHLAHAGLPLAGDRLYGGEPVLDLGQRHALHAHYAAWRGGGGVAGFRVRIDPPPEFASLLAR